MSIYICEECGCLDNTALGGNYWHRNVDPNCGQRALCCQCYTGKWHDQFEKVHWSTYGVDKIVEMNERCDGSMVNGISYLKSIGELPNDYVPKMRRQSEADRAKREVAKAVKERDPRRNRRGKIKAGKRKY